MSDERWPILDEDGREVAWAASKADAARIAWLMGMYEEYGALQSRQAIRRERATKWALVGIFVVPIAMLVFIVAAIFAPSVLRGVEDIQLYIAGAWMMCACIFGLYTVSKMDRALRPRFEHQRRRLDGN